MAGTPSFFYIKVSVPEFSKVSVRLIDLPGDLIENVQENI